MLVVVVLVVVVVVAVQMFVVELIRCQSSSKNLTPHSVLLHLLEIFIIFLLLYDCFCFLNPSVNVLFNIEIDFLIRQTDHSHKSPNVTFWFAV